MRQLLLAYVVPGVFSLARIILPLHAATLHNDNASRRARTDDGRVELNVLNFATAKKTTNAPPPAHCRVGRETDICCQDFASGDGALHDAGESFSLRDRAIID